MNLITKGLTSTLMLNSSYNDKDSYVMKNTIYFFQ